MHSKSENKEVMINDKADEGAEELFESLLNRYQNHLKESVRSSEFVFDYVHLLYYKCHEINLNQGRSYIDSPYSIKNKNSSKSYQQKR